MIHLVKYLMDGGDFLSICNAILKECIEQEEFGFDELGMMQISRDGSELLVIADCCNDGTESVFSVGKTLSMAECPYLTQDVSYEGNAVYVPIAIRDSVAMYLYGIGDTENEEDVQNLVQAAMIIQNIAARQNFEDSLANSYELLGGILDIVPTGIIVIDRENKSVLMMNKVAAQSEAIQSAIGKGLSQYVPSESLSINEIYDEETGLWFDVQFMSIRWVNGENVLMCTAIDVTQKVKNQLKAEYQANNDYLTGLFNRMKCERDLTEIIANVAEGERGIVIYLDLDDFKQVNDGLGHQYGDVLLQEISTYISSLEPIANSCYRMGGDEFVIVIRPEIFGQVTGIVQKISERFALPWDLLGATYYSTMSMGLAVFPDDGNHMHDILKKADFAMYEAKKGGKNKYLWYAECSDDNEASREEAEAEFKSSVENGCDGFITEYFEVKDSTGKAVGIGADIIYGKMHYEEIVSLAEYSGLTPKVLQFMGEKLLTKAANDSRKAYLRVEPVQILSKSVVKNFTLLAENAGIKLENVILCVADGAEFRDRNRAKANLELLKAYGFGIAIWNFGVGEMSLEKIFSYGADAVMVKNKKVQPAIEKMAESCDFMVITE